MGDRHAPRKNRMPKERKELIKQFIAQNEISSAKDIEEALKNMFKDTLQELLEAELDESLGYENMNIQMQKKKIIVMDTLRKQSTLLLGILN